MERTIVSLDLSTKSGIARFHIKDGDIKSLHFETLFPKKQIKEYGKYPFNYTDFAKDVGIRIVSEVSLIQVNHPDVEVVIEEVTAGKNPYSQKILDFIHYAVLTGLQSKKVRVSYIRTGIWRSKVGANLNDEEKRLNVKISRIKKQTGQRLAKIDGKVVGKITRKHAALRCFKEHFGYELPLNMNDACDAVLIGLAYIRGCSLCDGTLFGGTGSEEK
jgi:hypothetical protein